MEPERLDRLSFYISAIPVLTVCLLTLIWSYGVLD
jgi:hypothetical protein